MALSSIYIIGLALIAYFNKIKASLLGNRILEIDEEEIRIMSKKGIPEEIIKVNSLEGIILTAKHSVPFNTIDNLAGEVLGDFRQECLVVKHNKSTRQFNFIVDSNFMLNRLNHLLHYWSKKGYKANVEK